ncbi:hypothetical protein FAM21834_01598 [Lentilactobacillus parabuchneri]|uniref:hypothetical protein n=1 Tax=Lentilactobacillus parabuchneri TaxID=152331 RepID=UPI000A1143F5|nr:hypothetical protein [Lentilactobacillus parabuchneri]ORN08827.1 hypothetical protein FAM21834_01598 [Lentilactobacillus parabuchneri]
MFIYIKLDDKNFVSEYQNTPADGFIKVFLLDTWIYQFTQYPDKFSYDTNEQKLRRPDNLPDLSLAEMSEAITVIRTQVTTDAQQVQALTTGSAQGSTALTTLVQNQTMVAAQVQQVLIAITNLASQITSTKGGE